ncbi:MAG: AtpZ/AtpI family protein [Acidobacteriota bacterium]|nr:AtpZ/AtpI family protein [Acidobacteriota bacterium]
MAPNNDSEIRGKSDESFGDGARNKKNTWVQMANYAQLAIVFPAATVIGLLFGLALDHWLHTKWLYLVGLLLGIAAGFVELVRTASSNSD